MQKIAVSDKWIAERVLNGVEQRYPHAYVTRKHPRDAASKRAVKNMSRKIRIVLPDFLRTSEGLPGPLTPAVRNRREAIQSFINEEKQLAEVYQGVDRSFSKAKPLARKPVTNRTPDILKRLSPRARIGLGALILGTAAVGAAA